MEKITDMCGHYKRGSIVKDAKIKLCLGLDEFHFITKILTDDERETMREIPSIRLGNKQAMYSCSPFDCTLGGKKIYYNFATQEFERCIIMDMYCVPTFRDGSKLILKLEILLLDKGEYLSGISCRNIYNFSQRISHLVHTEKEAKLARLNIDGEQADMNDIYKQFKDYLSSSKRDTFDLKICGYDKDDNVYLVDLVDYKGENDTYLESVKKAKDNKVGKEESVIRVSRSEGPSDLEQLSESLANCSYKQREFKRIENANDKRSVIYYGAYDYFKRNIRKRFATDLYDVHVKKCLFKVEAINWYGPDLISLRPVDKDYELGHKRFVDSIKLLKCIKDISEDDDDHCKDHLYQPGQFVVFKNVFGDRELGKWLRGVVVSMSCYNEHSLVIGQRKTFAEKLENFKVVKRLVDDKKLKASELVYRVRSVDYGCECRCSPTDMRPVKDLTDFKRVGTWSLRCRLFGVHKFKGESSFSREAKHMFESWMREKIRDYGAENAFHAIFRFCFKTNERVDTFDKLIDISLFNRYSFEVNLPKNWYYMGERQPRFNSINWDLADYGLASSCEKDENSNLELERHVMDVLVKFKVIDRPTNARATDEDKRPKYEGLAFMPVFK